jgi:exodeoxyribonuclease VII large subunit
LRIGVVTSPTGAAVRDIINVLGRRFPAAKVILYPVLVQGEFAADSICKALKYFDETNGADVIIAGRGGGSIEDLWAFNEEKVALTISGMRIPVISAVGHETDFTIADFVADLRAPTPSAAAELAVPSTAELITKFNNVQNRLKLLLSNNLKYKKQQIDYINNSVAFSDPLRFINERRMVLDHIVAALNSGMKLKTANAGGAFSVLVGKLDSLSPLAVLNRGYSVMKIKEGKVINKAAVLTVGQRLTASFGDGSAEVTVEEGNLKGE